MSAIDEKERVTRMVVLLPGDAKPYESAGRFAPDQDIP
jgi:hypothetical protein